MEDDTTGSDPRGLNDPEKLSGAAVRNPDSESLGHLQTSDTTGSEEPEALPEPPSPQELEQAESLIRQANLAKIRGDKVGFEKLVEEAASVAPGSSVVMEAVGDAAIERRQVRKAKDAFQRAVRLDPNNASAERKFGEAVLAIQLALDPNFGSVAADDSLAGGKASVMLSFFIPGLGQIVSGDTKKGTALLVTWAIGATIALAIPHGLSGFASLFGRRGPEFNPVVILPLFVCVVCWMWSLSDSGAKAKRYEKKVIVHPTPPVDKDFEI